MASKKELNKENIEEETKTEEIINEDVVTEETPQENDIQNLEETVSVENIEETTETENVEEETNVETTETENNLNIGNSITDDIDEKFVDVKKDSIVTKKGEFGYIDGEKYKCLGNGLAMWARTGKTFKINK